MELHLDLVGGLAGDMFIAALLDAFPEHEPRVLSAIAAVQGNQVKCALVAHGDGVLHGRRFQVSSRQAATTPLPYAPQLAGHPAHAHVTWASIRSQLQRASLPPTVRDVALALFQLLADAEGFVHGIAAEAVSFHEVGAWDSIADIVGAAALIEAVGATRWTASPAPLGSGRVNTAHGILPVPAAATVRLLLGMATLDDGIAGERITPTGAALLRLLCPPTARAAAPSRPRVLLASGTGFGTRRLPGLSNHVRVLCFAPVPVSSAQDSGRSRRLLHVLEYEIDDQSGEELAMGLERIRTHAGVLDVTQTPTFGKKGRMMIHVQVLARDGALDDVVEACFRETTTIGLRHRTVQGVGLERRLHRVAVDGQTLRVKVVARPGGATAKTEADDVRADEPHARRAALRAQAEALALTGPDEAVPDA